MGATSSEGDGSQSVVGRLIDLAFKAIPAIGGAIGFVGFVALVGGAIEWVRFDNANLPASQAVSVIPRGELVILGAWTLAIFVLLGLLAVLIAFFSRRGAFGGAGWGFIALTAVEAIVVALMVGGRDAGWILLGWFVLVAAACCLAAAFGAQTALPHMSRWFHLRRIRQARSRWEKTNEETSRAQDWLKRLSDAGAPSQAIAEAERQLSAALTTQGRAEVRWAQALDTTEGRYELNGPSSG